MRRLSLLLFLNFYADSKMRTKLSAWPFISMIRMLKKSWWISNKIATFVPKNTVQKPQENYEVFIVQISPTLSWISKKLLFFMGVGWEAFYEEPIWLIVHQMRSNIFWKLMWYNFSTKIWYRCFTKKKTQIWHSGNGNEICFKENETPFGNLVCLSKMHAFAQYEIIWTCA